MRQSRQPTCDPLALAHQPPASGAVRRVALNDDERDAGGSVGRSPGAAQLGLRAAVAAW